jgi:hypothetical protein
MAKKAPDQPAVVSEELVLPKTDTENVKSQSEVNGSKEVTLTKPEEAPLPPPPVIEKEPIKIPYTTEEKILSFLKSRNTGSYIPINDFLKSLFPLAKMNEPKAWQNQHTMKTLKNTLEEMVKSGQIAIEGNIHQRLSKFYYPDSTTGVTHYYNLDTLIIKAKLA